MGRHRFTPGEIAELRRLIREKQTADQSRQKMLRARMRRMDFYISDFASDHIKMHLWGGIVNASAMAMKNKWPGRRACIDLFASYGLNRIIDTGELRWGSALLALHVDAGFDTYIFCDRDPGATHTLAERIADERYFALPVFDLDIGSEAAGARTTEIKGAVTDGPKVVVLTGDANEAPIFIRALMPAWEHNRYALTLIDPPSLAFWWESLEALTFNERMDLVLLFAEGMD